VFGIVYIFEETWPINYWPTVDG